MKTITQRNIFTRTKAWETALDLITYLYVLLFFYTACSKMITYSSFNKILSELPYLASLHAILAPAFIGLEVVLGILLIIPRTRIKGLWGAMLLMMVFTVYLGYNIIERTKLPCSCGGVISGMTWPHHLLFNSAFIAMAIAGLYINNRLKQTKISTRGHR
ncbi:hypothetical protein DBR40_07390 [Pedobacter sp. KBW01]|uniref:MauE/DoxX family redox-associated membrane protein n=1 Tax=Pedobacter sp. KBW01 TaxID=2153364 RepID=UPI000F5A0109|nr:MauE/DoxX family redox-associated membrane protein [Pedobacter sp. KBW01]RQO77791.1 hypothetical protein DBR40_07390 [Pedobacter sp. KBW01]